MHRLLAFALAMLLCPSALPASELLLRTDPAPVIHSQRMAGLAPSLRQWVLEAGRQGAESDPDAAAVGAAVRARLSGQDYSSTDVAILVQLVMMECAKQTDADLRATLEQMKAANERKQAQRESARAAAQARQDQKEALRASYEQRTKAPSASVDAIEQEKESSSELGAEQGRRLKLLQDRRARVFAVLSELQKKYSDTSGSITANLK